MATKDWERQNVGTIGNTRNIVWWQKKGEKFDDKLELFKADSIEGKPWSVEQRTLGKKNFKTKTKALIFTKSYRRKH